MQLKFHRHFKKSFEKLPKHLQTKVEETLQVFSRDPKNIQLKNHVLTGNLKGVRSISVTGDVRIIFEEFDNYTLVILLNVGTHNQVYR